MLDLGDEAETDSLTLLPTVIQHLPELLSKPSLAFGVFQAVRNASRSQRSLPFISPLLAPLTAVALTAAFAELRGDAVCTCVALVRALIARSLIPVATAYVLDLTAVGRLIIEHDASAPLSSLLADFIDTARGLAISEKEISSLDAVKIPPVPVSPSSLEALLYLLGAFIPSQIPLPFPEPASNIPVSQSASASQSELRSLSSLPDATSIRLWVKLGASSRSAVLNLASSHVLLSGRCGSDVAVAATSVLERAFDPASGCIVPDTIRRRLLAALPVVLEDSCFLSVPLKQANKIRLGLYKVARLASSSGQVPASVWNFSGIHAAVSDDGDVGSLLRSFSRCGLVSSESQDEPGRHAHEHGSAAIQRPRKRRRVADRPRFTDTEDQLGSFQQVFSQNTALSMDGGRPPGLVSALIRELEKLESIYSCVEDPKAVQTLCRVAALTTDSLTAALCNKASVRHDTLQSWLTFTHSICQIIKDVAGSIRLESERELWEGLLQLATECLRLASSLRSIEHIWCVDKPVPGNTPRTDCDLLLSSVVAVLNCASLTLGTAPKKVWVKTLSKLTWDFAEVARAGFPQSDEEKLSDTCDNLRRFALEDHIDEEPIHRELLLKSSFHITAALRQGAPADRIAEILPKLCAVFSEKLSLSPGLATAALHAISDVLCAKLKCRTNHLSPNQRREDEVQAASRIDEESWMSVFRVVSPVVRGTGADELITAATHCLGTLVIHAPKSKVGEATSILIQTLWHPTCHPARSKAITFISSLLTAHLSQRGGGIRLDESPTSLSSPVFFSRQEDSWDGFDKVLSMRGETNDVFRLLGVEMENRIQRWNNIIEHGKISEVEKLDISPLGMILRLQSDEFIVSRIKGLAVDFLLAIAIAELQFWLSSTSAEAAGEDSYAHTSEPALLFRAWNCLITHMSDLNIGIRRDETWAKGSVGISVARMPKSMLIDVVRGQLPVAVVVAGFLNSRIREWLPCAVPRMLASDSFSEMLGEILMFRDVDAFWKKVPKHAVGTLLRQGDAVGLESLALRVSQSKKDLVERVCADALARAAMIQSEGLDMSSGGANALIYESLQIPLRSIVAKRAGKIVQRVVMEIGGDRDQQARSALASLARILNIDPRAASSEANAAGALVSTHFMLVMDAVNRGLFNSRASEKERMRYLRMLDGVVGLARDRLHVYVPKILATLKMALETDRGSNWFREQTMKAWTKFLANLGARRMLPHLASILAILLPFIPKHENVLSATLKRLIDEGKTHVFTNWPEIVLLLRIADHPSLRETAKAIERELQSVESAAGINNTGKSTEEDETGTLLASCENVGKIIAQHENGVIEVMAINYLLLLLQRNRKSLDKILLLHSPLDESSERRPLEAIAKLLGSLVANLNKSKNKHCQEKILQCIGEIGALDPAIVSQFTHAPSETESSSATHGSHTYSCTVHSLVAFLLSRFLVPALVRGEKRDGSSNLLNRVGLVIQEILRVCGCRADTASRASTTMRNRTASDPPVDWRKVLVGDTEEENGIFFWENLESTTRTVVQPYLAEPFDVQHYKGVFGGNSAGDVSLACQPVWSKVKAASLIGVVATAQEWQRQTVVQLVDYIGNQSRFGKTLKALRPVLRYDDNVAAYMFPFAVAAALDIQRGNGSTEVQQFLLDEIASVLREGTSPQPVFDLLDTLRRWREERCKARGKLFSLRNQTPGGSTGTAKRRIPLEVNIARERNTDTLSPLVDLDGQESPELSLLVQAKSAYGARSYARAVMLAEYYIRNLRKNRGHSNWPAFIETLRGKEDNGIGLQRSGANEAFSILQKSFAELEDSDSMAGIASLKSRSSLADTVIDAEAAGRYDEALVTYERALAANPRHSKLHAGFLRCLMTLGHWETMLSHAEGLVSSAKLDEMELRQSAQALGIDAAWRLARWDKVEGFGTFSIDCDGEADCQSSKPWTLEFNVCFGKMLTSLQHRKIEEVRRAAVEARKHLLGPTTRLAREGYSRAYPMIAVLHAVSEVEDAMTAIGQVRVANQSSSASETDLERDTHPTPLITLGGRLNATATSLRIKEPLLSAKRVCYEVLNMQSEAACVNLQLAKLAHEGENLRAASAYAFNASSTASVDSEVKNEAALEMARICHDQGDGSGALLMVQKEIQRLLAVESTTGESEITDVSPAIAGRLCTAYVLAGRWVEEARSEPSDVILSFFEQAALLGPSREEPFYALGRHYDALLQAGANADANATLVSDLNGARSSRRAVGGGSNVNDPLHGSEYVPMVIRSFAQALCNGHSRIYEALPRMMTIWFDYHSAANCPDARLSGGPVEGEVKREIKKALDSIPVYMWMTAIPQLMSRLLHTRKIVRDELTQLLARIFCVYSDQSTWLILPSSQLKTADRKKAASDVLNTAVHMMKKGKMGVAGESRLEQARNLRVRIQGAISVMRSFIDICFTMLPKDRRGRVENCASEFRPLRHHLSSSLKTNPIIPTLRTLTVQLPNATGFEHRPFASEPTRIVDIENNALVMSSLMRPRRISLIGSDGRQYRFLAKKETAGDMRKDSRLVEFITVVNRLLSKDPVSRQKELELKTYAVLPLTEETGMIEWVNDLDPLRKLVREQHLAIPDLPDTSTVQSKYQNTKDHRNFLEWAITKFPPVLDKFFLQRFGGGTEPGVWLEARNVWTKSVAVWSMAGYVVGLGDRHGENVLVETTTGRCVHVDFAMLFDKGMKLKVPEIVPFRLTPNMITAMGISGYEGTFRIVSETVMGIMRRNSDALLGVLETFLHDPLADWGRSDTRGANGTIVASKEAWQTRAAVKAKLTGMVDSSGLPLSIQGQVQRLIHEATSMDSLSKMYLWWSGWV